MSFRKSIISGLFAEPQRLARAEAALRAIDDGLRELGTLGFACHLASGPAAPEPEFPKLMFHADSAPNGRLVADIYELGDLGPGWFDTQSAALHGAGVDFQFSGRGGVQRRGLPAVIG